jgi:hypothetical protein
MVMSSDKFLSIPASSKKRVIHLPLSSATARHRGFLKKLYQAVTADDKGSISKLLQKASVGEIRALAEISQNLLRKTYPETGKKFLSRLRPFKNLLRTLACCQTTDRQKRQILLRENRQTGGLPFIVPLLAPLVGHLLAAGISAAI